MTSRYQRAETIHEAAHLLAELGDEAKVLAGGQSLIPMMSLGLARPGVLVDIGRVEGGDRLELVEGQVVVGPTARHRRFETPGPGLDAAAPLLRATASHIAHPAIRSRGTFLGSVAHADPAAEWPAVVLALGADLVARSVRGDRTIPASEFFLGPLTSSLELDEILVEARWPVCRPATGAATRELTYRHGDYAIVGVAAQVTLGDGPGRIADARLALFGVGATPIRPLEAEAVLVHDGWAGLEEACVRAQEAADPSTDATASAAYRRRMVGVFVRRALEAAIREAETAGAPAS
jgi:aerobic carbon-monoxide dehydrogenase medium subunit